DRDGRHGRRRRRRAGDRRRLRRPRRAPAPRVAEPHHVTATPAQVHAALLDLRATVACAESLTGGLLAAALTETPGASSTMRGSLAVYATDLKATLAGVDPLLLAERGPVDPDVAVALAEGARRRLGATFGVGVTGVAGPDAQGDAHVGTVFVAVATHARTVV